MMNGQGRQEEEEENLQVDEYRNTTKFLGHIKNSLAGEIDSSKLFH